MMLKSKVAMGYSTLSLHLPWLFLFACWGIRFTYMLAFGLRFNLQKPRHWAKTSLELLLVKTENKSPKPKSTSEASCSSLQIDLTTAWPAAAMLPCTEKEGQLLEVFAENIPAFLLVMTWADSNSLLIFYLFIQAFSLKWFKFDFSILLLR